MHDRLVVLLLTTAATLILGVGVWLKNPSHRVNQCFAAFSVAVAGWTLSNGLVVAYAATPWGIVWARTAFVSAALIPLSFFLFARIFPVQTSSFRLATIFFLVCGTTAALLSLTPLIARSTSNTNGILTVHYGYLHSFFGAYFVLCLVCGMLVLYRKLPLLKGVERLQIRYVLVGLSLPIIAGTVTNLLIPLLLHSSQFSPYGPLFSIPMVGTIAHAIIRHRLMRIHVVIRRSAAYLVAICAAAAVFTTVLWLSSGLLLESRRESPLLLEVSLVLLIAVAFQPFQRAAKKWVDRYLFRDPYDYQKTIREISRNMAGILNLRPLLEYACDAMNKTVRPEFVAVYFYDAQNAAYTRLVHTSKLGAADLDRAPDSLAASSPLVTLLLSEKRTIVRDGWKLRASSIRTQQALMILTQLRVDLAFPIIEDQQLVGFFLLGPRLSGDPYFPTDIDLLTTLMSQATIAIKNSQLYSQVVLANEYVQNILRTIDSAVVTVDAEGTITLFNSAATQMFGLDGAPAATSLNDLPQPIAQLLRATLKDSEPRAQVETAIQAHSGDVLPVICSTSPLRDNAGTVLGAVAVLSDLTRLKTLEGEKQQAERLASIGALASGIAHEISNPLVAIKTFAELLPERFSEDDFRNDFASVVTREIERIDGLVSRLRTFARPATKPFTDLDLRRPLEETLALLRGQLERSQISVKLVLPARLPLVRGDASQLEQLFLNVIVNALEAMPPRGQLTVRARIRRNDGRETVLVEISDTGCGIPDGLLEKIFDPFLTTKQRGSGIGLSICRAIADAHHAAMSANNNADGRGATIAIEFPVSDEVVAIIG